MTKRLKGLLRPALLTLYIWTLRLLRVISPSNPHSVLVIPPYSPGSLGDEAILTAGIKELEAHGLNQIGLVAYQCDDNWAHIGRAAEMIDMEDYFFRGHRKALFRFARSASRYKYCYLFGTDVMDGFYGELGTMDRTTLAKIAAATGAFTTVVGFSFNAQPSPGAVMALKQLPRGVRLCARDAISRERLAQHAQRPVDLVADVAFLLEPARRSDLVTSTTDWVNAQKTAGRIVVGINVSQHLMKQVTGLEAERLARAYALAMTEMFSQRQELSFLLIPHDTREEINDTTLAQATMGWLPDQVRPHCLQVPTPIKAAEIKAICGTLDIMLSGRMHVAIACLGQGTPVACITYQGKFEGLFQHFELDGMTITPELALQPGKLSEFFLPLVEKRKELRQHIKAKLPRIQELAQANFEQNGQLNKHQRST